MRPICTKPVTSWNNKLQQKEQKLNERNFLNCYIITDHNFNTHILYRKYKGFNKRNIEVHYMDGVT